MATLKIAKVPIDRLRPNDWNPNVLDGAMLERLRGSLKRRGFVQPIIAFRERVRGYVCLTIIDGKHRWEIWKELGHSYIPTLILPVNAATARELTVNLNYLRGEPDWDRYGELVQWFVDHGSSTKRLHEVLPLSRVDIDEMLAQHENRLSDTDAEIERSRDAQREAVTKSRIYQLTFGPFSSEEREEVERILGDKAFQKFDEAELLLRLLRTGCRVALRALGKIKHGQKKAR